MKGYYGWQNDYFDPEPWDDEEFDYSQEPDDVNEIGDEEEEWEDAMMDCGFVRDFGTCTLAGTEQCDECVVRPVYEKRRQP